MSSSDFAHDPSSLAAALNRVDPALDPTLPVASSDHAVLDYLSMEYSDEGRRRRTTSVPGPSRRRSASPVDPSVPIDPHLAALASAATAHAVEVDVPGTPFPSASDYGMLGEMGGKRKKLPHERAGWDQLGQPPAKRGRKSEREEGSSDPKKDRAEQNKKAQQAFRKRREERMKELEAAAASLEPMQRRLAQTEDKLAETALSLDSAEIQIAALQAALRSAAGLSGQPILTSQNYLAISSSVPRRTGSESEADIDAAFGALAQQSRELAKQNKARRARAAEEAAGGANGQDHAQGHGNGHGHGHEAQDGLERLRGGTLAEQSEALLQGQL